MTDFITKSRESAAQGDVLASYRHMVSAVEADPENADAWYGLGYALHEFKKYTASAAAFTRADQLRPGHHDTLSSLGVTLGLVGRYEEAAVFLLRAIGVGQDKAPAYVNLANVLAAMGDEDSTEFARQGVKRDLESPIAHMQYAFDLLRDGRWLEGFQEYEWRFKYKLPEFLSYACPLWRGEETGTLLIVAEQGHGDTIQMMRFIPLAASRADRVIWLCNKEMTSLAEQFCTATPAAASALQNVEVRPMPTPVPAADAFIPDMSLPVALGIKEVVPGPPYISVGERFRVMDGEYRVGLVWAGSQTHDNAWHRDTSLVAMLPLTEIPDIKFYSLQVGAARSQMDEQGAHGLITDLSGRISNFADTAREIAALDLVISVDTAAAHLAGAMGKECWLLVNQCARDWRWGRRGEQTVWYPSVRIFERALIDDTWTACLDEVAVSLCEAVSNEP